MSPSTAWYAVSCGLCMLIPLPWVDELAERRVTRNLYASLGTTRGVAFADGHLKTLTEDRSSLVVGCLVGAVRWPLKKLFRTIFYFLTIKDVLDGLTRAVHRASMLEEALERGLLPHRAAEVRDAMDHVLARHRVSPVSRLLWFQERPELGLPQPTFRLGRVLRWFQRQGGGGVLLPVYRGSLDSLL